MKHLNRRFSIAFRVLALACGLSACLDFVEPTSLNLSRPTRLEVYLNVTAGPFASCSAATPPPTAPPGGADGSLALVCLEAKLVTGIDSLGRTRPVLNDTLYALGSALAPAETFGDSIRQYRAAWQIPSTRLADTVFRVVYPIVQGATFPRGGFEWYAVSRTTPDTVLLAAGGNLSLAVQRPRAAPQPLPRLQQWGLEVYGGNGTVALRGIGVPRSRFDLPGALLADLPGAPFAASLRYLQLFFSDPGADANAALYVQMTQTVDWVIRRPAAAPPVR